MKTPSTLYTMSHFLFKVHVNKEIFVLFNVMDENLSWYIDESIKEFSPDKALLDKNDEAFKHGNLIHGKSCAVTNISQGVITDFYSSEKGERTMKLALRSELL